MNLNITTKNSTVITLNHCIRKVRANRPTGLSTIGDPIRMTIPPLYLSVLKPGVSPCPVEYHLRNRCAPGIAVTTTAFPDSRENILRGIRTTVNDLRLTTHGDPNRPITIQHKRFLKRFFRARNDHGISIESHGLYHSRSSHQTSQPETHVLKKTCRRHSGYGMVVSNC